MLVQCAAARKVDLRDVPLHPIGVAYIEYLRESESPDLEGAVSALLALAYLIERKAEALLPQPEVEDHWDEDEEFIAPSFSLFRPSLNALNESWDSRDQLFFRSVDEDPGLYELPVTLSNVKLADLGRALEAILARAVPEEVHPLGRPRRSLAEQMRVVLRCLRAEAAPLEELIEGEWTRTEAVWWFLALLELIRLGQAAVRMGDEGELVFWRADLSCN